MKRAPSLASLFALAATSCVAPAVAPPTAAGPALLLINANLIDGLGSPPVLNGSVLIRSGKIERFAAGRMRVPPVIRVIDLDGAWILPGLIDAHVHLRDLESARRALLSGVTTARSLGADHFIDIRIAQLHREKATSLPDVIAAGYHVRRRPSDALFVDSPELLTSERTVVGPEAVRRTVRTLAERGVKVIKVMATERAGIPATDFRQRMLDSDELRAAVDEAAKHGLPVAAHAHTDDGARAAVAAGVRSIEHGTLISRSTFELMRRRKVCFVPTLSFWADMAEPGGEYDHSVLAERARVMRPVARRAVATAARVGVRIAAGSDMRYDSVSPYRLADEIAELVRSGLTSGAAIKAATSGAAACLRIAHRTGMIRAGLEADLIAVRGNPLADPRALKDIRLVINDGVVALDRLGQ